jgi:hypothetical protein
VQRTDLTNLFPYLFKHLDKQIGEIVVKVTAAGELIEERKDLNTHLMGLRLRKGLSDRFHMLLGQEVMKDEDIANLWDFVNIMSTISHKFSLDKRLHIERIAGELIGLCFSKT